MSVVTNYLIQIILWSVIQLLSFESSMFLVVICQMKSFRVADLRIQKFC